MNENLSYLIKNYKQIISTTINESGQLKIKKARILLVGVGGLGNICALYLSSMGIGELGIIDDDSIDLTNLHRQVAYYEKDINKKKIYVIKKKINKNSKYCKVFCYDFKINFYSFLHKFKNYDIIIDGTDNLIAREVINCFSLKLKIPFIYGSVNNFEGRVSVFNFNNNACYQCLELNDFVDLNNCSDSGILGVIPGLIGLMQAYEAIKIIISLDNILFNKLLIFNFVNYDLRIFSFFKKKNCICSNFIFSFPVKKQLKCFNNKIEDYNFFISIFLFKEIIKSNIYFILIYLSEANFSKIKNSLHFSLENIYKNNNIIKKFFFFSKKFLLIFYCHTGIKSYFLCSFLKEKKIKSYCLLGGYINYKNTVNYLKID